MVYYFYIRWTENTDQWRFLVAAPDVETVDEWWRFIQQSGQSANFARLSSDFFTSAQSGHAWKSLENTFNTRLLYTLIDDAGGRQLQTFHQKRSDPISGNSFYIRSKSSPDVYWYVTGATGGQIYASSLGRTRFCVRADGEKDGAYMIRNDKISIKSVTNTNLGVSLNHGVLYLSDQTNYFRYGELKDRFLAQGETRLGGEGRNTAVLTAVEAGMGEEWELVS